MSGIVLHKAYAPHVCEPPGGRMIDQYDTPMVGTVWQCDCGQVWQVRDGIRPNYPVHRGWVKLGPVAAWRWRRRRATGPS